MSFSQHANCPLRLSALLLLKFQLRESIRNNPFEQENSNWPVRLAATPIDKVCENSVCLRLLMIPLSSSRWSTLSWKLSADLLAAHVLLFQLRYRLYGGTIRDFLRFEVLNDLDVSVPKDVSLLTALVHAFLPFSELSLKRLRSFSELETARWWNCQKTTGRTKMEVKLV